MLEALFTASGPVVASLTSWPNPLINTRSDSLDLSLASTINILLAVFCMRGTIAQKMPAWKDAGSWHFLSWNDPPEILSG